MVHSVHHFPLVAQLPMVRHAWNTETMAKALTSKNAEDAAITNAEWLARRQAAVARGVSTATSAFAAQAENALVWDVEGRRYIDFVSGIGVLATGHRNPDVLSAVRDQLDRYTHTSFQVMAYGPYIELAERLNALAPIQGGAKSFLVNSGAEAVENAVKIARLATQRNSVVAFGGAFHGRTLLTMGLTGKVAPYKKGLGTIQADIHRVPFPVTHRGLTVNDTLRALEDLFYSDLDPQRTAAILIEPVQGEGGFNVAPPDLLQQLRAICDRYGILLIADEVQSGMGRTGRMFAIEHSGVKPDLITVAKALGGGFPIAGVIGRASLMDQMEPGSLGTTYGGSPVCCAAALAVLDVISKEQLVQRAERLGLRVRARLESWAKRSDLIPVRNVRGLGVMLGFDLPRAEDAKRVAAIALEKGLLILTCGRSSETVRLLVPLTIEEALIDEGLGLLEASLSRDLHQ